MFILLPAMFKSRSILKKPVYQLHRLRHQLIRHFLLTLRQIQVFFARNGLTRRIVLRACLEQFFEKFDTSSLRDVTSPFSVLISSIRLWFVHTIRILGRFFLQELTLRYTSYFIAYKFERQRIWKVVEYTIRNRTILKELFDLFYAYFQRRVSGKFVCLFLVNAIAADRTPLYLSIPLYIISMKGEAIYEELRGPRRESEV